MAKTAKEALEKERKVQADDVWVDEKFMDDNKDAIGFNYKE